MPSLLANNTTALWCPLPSRQLHRCVYDKGLSSLVLEKDYYQQAAKKKSIGIKVSTLKWKIAQCHLKLEEDRLACAVVCGDKQSGALLSLH